MNYKKKISISWSGGKDSALMLWHIISDKTFDIVELHTLLNKATNRVGLHGIHKTLIQAQADSIGIPLKFIYIETSSNNSNYENAMDTYYTRCKSKGITHIAFGDIFLEDLKSYRDKELSKNSLYGHYPLWNQKTKKLSLQFIDKGFKTIICAADTSKIKQSITGRLYTKDLLEELPDVIDPCGENGEFHTFCFDGSMFKHPILVEIGTKENHHYEFENEEGKTIKNAFEFIDLALIMD